MMAVLEVLFSLRNRDASDAIRIRDLSHSRISLILLGRLSRDAICRVPDAGYRIVDGPEAREISIQSGIGRRTDPKRQLAAAPVGVRHSILRFGFITWLYWLGFSVRLLVPSSLLRIAESSA